jgi:hypothetical protein
MVSSFLRKPEKAIANFFSFVLIQKFEHAIAYNSPLKAITDLKLWILSPARAVPNLSMPVLPLPQMLRLTLPILDRVSGLVISFHQGRLSF